MLAPPPCLASVAAFEAATPTELAAAVIHLGFVDQADRTFPEITTQDVFQRVVIALRVVPDHEPRSYKWIRATQEPAVAGLAYVVEEGVLVAEQRLLLSRRPSSGDSSRVWLTLLRRGSALLRSGDVATYLG